MRDTKMTALRERHLGTENLRAKKERRRYMLNTPRLFSSAMAVL